MWLYANIDPHMDVAGGQAEEGTGAFLSLSRVVCRARMCVLLRRLAKTAPDRRRARVVVVLSLFRFFAPFLFVPCVFSFRPFHASRSLWTPSMTPTTWFLFALALLRGGVGCLLRVSAAEAMEEDDNADACMTICAHMHLYVCLHVYVWACGCVRVCACVWFCVCFCACLPFTYVRACEVQAPPAKRTRRRASIIPRSCLQCVRVRAHWTDPQDGGCCGRLRCSCIAESGPREREEGEWVGGRGELTNCGRSKHLRRMTGLRPRAPDATRTRRPRVLKCR